MADLIHNRKLQALARLRDIARGVTSEPEASFARETLNSVWFHDVWEEVDRYEEACRAEASP